MEMIVRFGRCGRRGRNGVGFIESRRHTVRFSTRRRHEAYPAEDRYIPAESRPTISRHDPIGRYSGTIICNCASTADSARSSTSLSSSPSHRVISTACLREPRKILIFLVVGRQMVFALERQLLEQ